MTEHQHHADTQTPRRTFLGHVAAGVAALAGLGAVPARLLGERRRGFGGAHLADDWMDALTGKHRTVFDMSAHKNGKPLTQAKNYLDAWRDAFTVSERDLNLVIGIHGEGIPVVLTDALWTRFRIGEQYGVVDGGTKTAGVRNVFTTMHAVGGGLVNSDQTVETLQGRGVRFLVCMNTIAGATKKLAAAGLGTPEEIRPALLNGLLPGVIVVPSMVVTFTQLQERDVAYVTA